MAEIPLEGFAYDSTKAQAMADAIDAVFAQAALAGPALPDKLAALGLAAALLIARSPRGLSAEKAAAALSAFIVANAQQLAAASRQG